MQNIQTMIDDSVGIDVANPTNALEVPLITTSFDHDNNTGTPARVRVGSLRSDTSVQAERYCETDGTNCFNPLRLAGTPADAITCADPAQIMTGIRGGGAEGEAICEDAVFFCPNAAFPILQGVNGLGQPNCVAKPLLPCNGLTVQLCAGVPKIDLWQQSLGQKIALVCQLELTYGVLGWDRSVDHLAL